MYAVYIGLYNQAFYVNYPLKSGKIFSTLTVIMVDYTVVVVGSGYMTGEAVSYRLHVLNERLSLDAMSVWLVQLLILSQSLSQLLQMTVPNLPLPNLLLRHP